MCPDLPFFLEVRTTRVCDSNRRPSQQPPLTDASRRDATAARLGIGQCERERERGECATERGRESRVRRRKLWTALNGDISES